MNREEILKHLNDVDNNKAYEFAKRMTLQSTVSSLYYDYIKDFASMLKSDNSYVRTRGFILICSLARWDKKHKINRYFKKMVPCLNDDSPIATRQCIKALKEVATYIPSMHKVIGKALDNMDLSKYKDSMVPLINKDINELRKLLID